MRGGYMGKILNVNLSSGKIEEEALDEKICRDFIGTYGLGARILFSRQRAKVDPLGPENILGFVSGPLTGTPALFGNRFSVVGKSPLTSAWGNSMSGGYFGPFMKFSGYDAIFISGISEKPVYLFINEGKAELRDASALWGKDTRETESILKAELGSDTGVALIGPSAEKLSLIAGIFGDTARAAARTGLGAVMGAKKLKAIAVKGKAKVPLANSEEIERLRRKHLAKVREHPQTKDFSAYGTGVYTQYCVEVGEVEYKNWAGARPADMPDVSPLYGDKVVAGIEARYGCYRCPVACGARMKAGTGKYQWEAGSRKPEYETIAQLGTLCLNDNLESIIKANDICNRYGIDTISAGGVIAFAIECYEKGLINQKDTDGIELSWGNHQAIVAMLEKLVRREGFGDILADGSKRAAERIGKSTEQYAMHILGEEIPAHDPRAEPAYATLYITDAAPALHGLGGEMYAALTGRFEGTFDPKSYTGRGEAHRLGRDFMHVLNATGVCMIYYMTWFNLQDVLENVNAVTGWGLEKPDELLVCADRIANIRQAFNIREGLTLKDFQIPDRVIGRPPLPSGPTAGRTVDYKVMVKDFLKASDWDLKTGKPSKEKLLSLGLKDVAAELWP